MVEQAGSHSESGVKPAIQKCKAGINPFNTLQSVNNRRNLMLNNIIIIINSYQTCLLFSAL